MIQAGRCVAANGEIDWVFVNRVACGVVTSATQEERELAIKYAAGGRWAVRRALGLLSQEEIDKAAAASRALQYDQDYSHSCWGRGRKTTSK